MFFVSFHALVSWGGKRPLTCRLTDASALENMVQSCSKNGQVYAENSGRQQWTSDYQTSIKHHYQQTHHFAEVLCHSQAADFCSSAARISDCAHRLEPSCYRGFSLPNDARMKADAFADKGVLFRS